MPQAILGRPRPARDEVIAKRLVQGGDLPGQTGANGLGLLALPDLTPDIAPVRLETLSTADEFSPNVANENSPLRCGLVASVSAWRFDVGEFG